MIKKVVKTVRAEMMSPTQGLLIADLKLNDMPEIMDPFLSFSEFEMAQPFFPPHPHAGFSAVTYMLPDSENGFLNRDSRGDRIDIRPGDLHWTGAGAGIMHEETPLVRGVVAHGLQIFVNLRSHRKWMEPRVLHVDAADIPLVARDGMTVRVVAGRWKDAESPLRPPTEVTLLDVELEAHAVFEADVLPGEGRFAYVLEGRVDAGSSGETVSIERREAAGFAEAGEVLRIVASGDRARVIIAGGAPLREPIVFSGPFCMNSQEDILRVRRAFQAGEMGQLERSF